MLLKSLPFWCTFNLDALCARGWVFVTWQGEERGISSPTHYVYHSVVPCRALCTVTPPATPTPSTMLSLWSATSSLALILTLLAWPLPSGSSATHGARIGVMGATCGWASREGTGYAESTCCCRSSPWSRVSMHASTTSVHVNLSSHPYRETCCDNL